MIRTIKRLLFGERPTTYPPLKAGEHLAAVPTERPTFNEWAMYIKQQATILKYGKA